MKTLKHQISFLVIATALAVSAAAQTSLTSLDGTKVDVEAQNGKVVVMAMGAAWLPLSAKQAEYTNALAKKYAGKNVVVYFVMTDSANSRSNNYTSPEEIKRFVATNKISVTVFRDPDGLVTLKKFNVDQVPSFVLLNKQGDIAGEPFGGIDPKYDITIPISRAIDKLL